MLDHPDWLKEVAGSLRYVGSFQVTEDGGGNGENSLAFAVTPLERAVIVMCPQLGAAATQEIQVFEGQSPYLVTQNVVLGPDAQIVIGYINPELSGSWVAEAIINGDTGYSGPYYVFTDTQLPLTMIANGPVPLNVNLVQADQHTGVVPVGVIGPAQTRPQQWDGIQTANAANTTGTSVTFAATAGKAWLLNYVVIGIANNTAQTAVGWCSINGGIVYYALPATAGADKQIILPGLSIYGAINTAVSVSITEGSGTNKNFSIYAGAWLI